MVVAGIINNMPRIYISYPTGDHLLRLSNNSLDSLYIDIFHFINPGFCDANIIY